LAADTPSSTVFGDLFENEWYSLFMEVKVSFIVIPKGTMVACSFDHTYVVLINRQFVALQKRARLQELLDGGHVFEYSILILDIRRFDVRGTPP
jgi:hypothetical protein